jgi:hypothetical protein
VNCSNCGCDRVLLVGITEGERRGQRLCRECLEALDIANLLEPLLPEPPKEQP